jgi:hypothetical protein
MNKKGMPKEHPVAWASPLWPHLETIRSMRRQRKKWTEIADHLANDHGVKVTFRTVRNFFKRSTDPNRKLPLGFEPDQPKAQASFTDPTTKRPDTPADHRGSEGDVYDDALEAHLQTQKQPTGRRPKIQPGTKL